MALYGPTIEGVVSPTASATTRKKALASASTPGTYQDQGQYLLAKDSFNSGASTSATGTLLSNTSLAQQGSLQPTAAPTTSPFGGHDPSHDLGKMSAIQTEFNRLVAENQARASGTGTGTGVGGATGTQDPHVDGAGDPTTGGGSGLGGLGDVSREAIEAQINALTAQYGLDLEGIAALGGEIGSQARFLLAQLNRDQGFAQENLLGNLVGRGVYRSGITARDTGRLQGDFAVKRAEVEMNKGQQLRQLAERAGVAKMSLARGKADVISEIDAGNLPAELRQALLNELNSLTPQQIEQALAASKQPLPPIDLTDEDLVNRSTFSGGSSAASGYSPIKF